MPGQPAKLTIRLKVLCVSAGSVDPLGAAQPWIASYPSGNSMANVRRGQVLDYNNNSVTCRSWLVPEWNADKIRFKRAVEHAWNNQLILLPTDSSDPNDALNDADYRQLIGNPNVRAHVEGAIDIALMPLNTAGHALIESAHLDFRQPVPRVDAQDHLTVGSVPDISRPQPPGLVDRSDHRCPRGRSLAARRQRHPFRPYRCGSTPRHCQPRSRPKRNGRTLGRKEALMGDGSRVTEHEARPWLTRIRRQTPMKLGWSMMHSIEFRRVMSETTDREKQLASRP